MNFKWSHRIFHCIVVSSQTFRFRFLLQSCCLLGSGMETDECLATGYYVDCFTGTKTGIHYQVFRNSFGGCTWTSWYEGSTCPQHRRQAHSEEKYEETEGTVLQQNTYHEWYPDGRDKSSYTRKQINTWQWHEHGQQWTVDGLLISDIELSNGLHEGISIDRVSFAQLFERNPSRRPLKVFQHLFQVGLAKHLQTTADDIAVQGGMIRQIHMTANKKNKRNKTQK